MNYSINIGYLILQKIAMLKSNQIQPCLTPSSQSGESDSDKSEIVNKEEEEKVQTQDMSSKKFTLFFFKLLRKVHERNSS